MAIEIFDSRYSSGVEAGLILIAILYPVQCHPDLKSLTNILYQCQVAWLSLFKDTRVGSKCGITIRSPALPHENFYSNVLWYPDLNQNVAVYPGIASPFRLLIPPGHVGPKKARLRLGSHRTATFIKTFVFIIRVGHPTIVFVRTDTSDSPGHCCRGSYKTVQPTLLRGPRVGIPTRVALPGYPGKCVAPS
eukprot:618634-Rhodomonas_salina.1